MQVEIKKIEHHLLVAIVGPSIRVIKRNGPFPRSHLFCGSTSKSKAIMKAIQGGFVFLISSSSPVSPTQSTIWRVLMEGLHGGDIVKHLTFSVYNHIIRVVAGGS